MVFRVCSCRHAWHTYRGAKRFQIIKPTTYAHHASNGPRVDIQLQWKGARGPSDGHTPPASSTVRLPPPCLVSLSHVPPHRQHKVDPSGAKNLVFDATRTTLGGKGGEICAALNIEVLRGNDVWSSTGMQGRSRREIPETKGIVRHDSHMKKPGEQPHRESNPVRLNRGRVI
ncbi:hypothetical protein PR048_025015 [Dryococelus australis]|uniref:Uncharacterized protein n=1 Tax=Dryococelus australis TaxID=614101 RepID=A0ABQ9GQ72_9NEOP|nr:hypothetical protein PR048_025015 [Dryococelus australis]